MKWETSKKDITFHLNAHCLKITKNVAFQKLVKLTIFGIFNQFLSTQNVNAQFASLAKLNATFWAISKHCPGRSGKSQENVRNVLYVIYVNM